MQLFLLRHGLAEPGGKDAERPLAAPGLPGLHSVLELASFAGLEPDIIISSPLVRAQQTARLAATLLGYGGDIPQKEALLPGASTAELWSELQPLNKHRQVLCVGHEPLLSTFIAFLLRLRELPLHFQPASMACIELPLRSKEPDGFLRWLIGPDFAVGHLGSE